MYRLLLTVFLFISLSATAQNLSNVRKNIDTLCAPGMHGRGAVNKGDSIASAYISSRFQALNLKFFGANFFQPFSFDINTFPGAFSLKAGKTLLQPGKDFIADPASGGGKKKLKTVYLDTAIFKSENARKRFLNCSLRKKAIVYTSKDKARLVNMPVEIVEFINQSPCHIILYDKLTASLSSEQSITVQFNATKKAFESKPESVEFAIDARLLSNYQCQNVIGYIEGKTYKDSFVVFSAHYDHLGRMGKNVYFPGANDNASGVSMLLELANYYSKPENRQDYSIVFMAFGAEEAGLLGSHHYVENPLFPLSQIGFLINLDLLGTGDDGIMVVNGSVLPEYFDKLVSINKEKNLVKEIKKRGQAANSDHYYFYKAGVPAVFIYTLGGITAYHDIFDVPATLPLTDFEDVFKLLTEFVTRL